MRSVCRVGILNMWMVPKMPKNPSTRIIHTFCIANIEIPSASQINRMILYFVFFGIPRPLLKFSMMGPKNLCVTNQWWNLGDDLAKHAAASNIKGVVGNRGITIPITPKTIDAQPAMINNKFFSVSSCLVKRAWMISVYLIGLHAWPVLAHKF